MTYAPRWPTSAAVVGASVCALVWLSAAPRAGAQTLAAQPRLVVFEAIMPRT
jgi:hypothetical protein